MLAAGDTYLSRITALLEEILQPISIRYCSSVINEYCKDSKSYLTKLHSWKNTTSTGREKEEHFVTAADVKALYPSLDRHLIKLALEDALKKCSDLGKSSQELVVKLCIYCLENVLIEFRERYYKQDSGIPTGENNSVSLANIALHYIIAMIPEISSHTVIFQRYIDDIIYICPTQDGSNQVKELLCDRFNEYGLELTFREMKTGAADAKIEFLDVLHCADTKATKGFFTKDYIKPTATGHTFINGKSHHPPHIFKGIVLGEGKRLRRLNETDQGFKESIHRLKEKCLKSDFNERMVSDITSRIQNWRFNSTEQQNHKKVNENNRLTWSTQFKNILKLGRKEKDLVPKTALTYCRPPTIGKDITNYRFIAKEKARQTNGSYPCNGCGLCGNYGVLENMVLKTNKLKLENGKEIEIKDSINCRDHGIYGARCRTCSQFYIGQTKNPFSERWNSHRGNWKSMIESNGSCSSGSGSSSGGGGSSGSGSSSNNKVEAWADRYALFLHYKKNHSNLLSLNSMKLSDAYEVVFIEKPNFTILDTRENFWIRKLNASINLSRTFLPKYM